MSEGSPSALPVYVMPKVELPPPRTRRLLTLALMADVAVVSVGGFLAAQRTVGFSQLGVCLVVAIFITTVIEALRSGHVTFDRAGVTASFFAKQVTVGWDLVRAIDLSESPEVTLINGRAMPLRWYSIAWLESSEPSRSLTRQVNQIRDRAVVGELEYRRVILWSEVGWWVSAPAACALAYAIGALTR